MKTSTVVWIVVIVAVLLGGWYWWSGMQNATTPAVGTQTSAENTQAPVTTTNTTTYNTSSVLVLNVNSDTKLGQYLASSNGMTLYTYSKDTSGVSNCSGSCASNWPPYTVAVGAKLPVAAGITGKVATIKRANGTMQVTYNGMPLYLWVQDAKPNDVTGNNVGGFLLAKP